MQNNEIRTKTSIRYAKDNGREKREREKGRRRDKAQRKVDFKNYDAITIRRNYDRKF